MKPIFEQPTELRIGMWNLNRCETETLQFISDLEMKMLSEEASEFFHATDIVDRIDAFCDFLYVLAGTIWKYCAQKYESKGGFTTKAKNYNRIMEWADVIKYRMETLLLSELRSYIDEPADIHLFMEQALKAVVDANDAKGTKKDDNGKVMKGADYVPPEDTITGLLFSYTNTGVGGTA